MILNEIIDDLNNAIVDTQELQKILMKIMTSKEFQEQGILNRAMNLCAFELLGDAEMINHESDHYKAITPNDINRVSTSILVKTNCSLLKIKAISNAE